MRLSCVLAATTFASFAGSAFSSSASCSSSYPTFHQGSGLLQTLRLTGHNLQHLSEDIADEPVDEAPKGAGLVGANSSSSGNSTMQAADLLNASATSTGGVFNSANESTVYFGMLIAVAYLLVAFACRLEKPGQVQRVEAWTGFRWALALWIFLEHHKVHPMTGSGAFLLLSGAMLSLSRRDVVGVPGYLAFLARRLARIYPAYWLALSAFLVVRHDLSPLTVFTHLPQDHPGLFIAAQPWMPNGKENRLWFIGTVIELYAVFPLLSRLLGWLGTRQSAGRCALAAAFCYAAQWAVALYALGAGYNAKAFRTPSLDLKLYNSPLTRLPQFVLGMTLGHMLQALSGKEHAWQGWVLSGLTDAAAVGALAIAVAGRVFDLGSFGGMGLVYNDFFLFSPVIYLLLLGVALATQPSATSRIFTSTPILVLGKWSYGIYLWNLFISISHSWWPHTSAWGIAAEYAFCVVASALSFHLVEEPAQRLVDRLLDRK